MFFRDQDLGPSMISQEELVWDLSPDLDSENPRVERAAERFLDVFPGERPLSEDLETWWWKDPSGFAGISVDLIRHVFTEDELSRMMFQATRSSLLGDWMEAKDRNGRVVWKIRNSMWRFGMELDWNVLVSAYEGIRRFHFGHGLTPRLDMTTGCNERGYSLWRSDDRNLFLDGVFGFVLTRSDGEPVATLGFSISKKGVLIQQVQMVRRRGNRWLFKLDKPLTEWVVDCFDRAFDLPLWMITGEGSLHLLEMAYDRPPSDVHPPRELSRIRGVYDCPMKDWSRGESQKWFGAWYRKLEPKVLEIGLRSPGSKLQDYKEERCPIP